MANIPEFKPNFKYSNVGLVVGTLCYAKELQKKTGETYGHEFLINAKGHGSINVRVPSLPKSNYALQNFPVAEKPRVRVGLATLSQFFANTGKIYTSVTSFVEMQEAVKLDGSEMPDSIKGRLGGEVFNIKVEQDGHITCHLVAYETDKNGNRTTLKNGKPVDPRVIQLHIVDPAIIEEFKAKVKNGSNIEVGYSYVNKDDVSYDEYGLPVGSGNHVDRVEVGRLIVHSAPQQQQNMGGFGNFQQPQQQQPQQQFVDPFASTGTVVENDPFANNGNNFFGVNDYPF